jgi:DNA-binding beta-propeller fold protein YncE
VRAGNLDGSGTAQTLFTETDGSNSIGVAVDPAAGKVYWTDLGTSLVRSGNLNGTGASTLFNSPSPAGPAVDPTTNKIYWTSWTSGSGIRVGNQDGSGTASTLFNGESAALSVAEERVEHRHWSDVDGKRAR